jgi:hypothetical protein
MTTASSDSSISSEKMRTHEATVFVATKLRNTSLEVVFISTEEQDHLNFGVDIELLLLATCKLFLSLHHCPHLSQNFFNGRVSELNFKQVKDIFQPKSSFECILHCIFPSDEVYGDVAETWKLV